MLERERESVIGCVSFERPLDGVLTVVEEEEEEEEGEEREEEGRAVVPTPAVGLTMRAVSGLF